MEKSKKKQLALKALALFFGIMLVCTVLSRAAASVTVPQVEAKTCSSGKLRIQMEGQGIVETREEQVISLQEGLRVSRLAKAGNQVEQDQVLLQYDLEYLGQVIQENEAELKKLQLSLAQAQVSGQPQQRVLAQESAGKQLDAANEALSQAQAARQQAETGYEEGEAQARQTLEQEKNQAQEALDAAAAQARELEAEGNVQEAQEVLAQAQKAYEEAVNQAQEAYDATVGQLEAQKAQAQDSAWQQEQAQIQAQNAYEEAVSQDAADSENDKRTQEQSSYEQESIQVDISLKEQEIQKLKTLESAKGEVKAPRSGVVKSVNLSAGSITAQDSCILLGCGGYQVRCTLDAEDLANVQVDDQVKLSLAGKKKELNTTVSQILGQTKTGNSGQVADTEEAGQDGSTAVFLANIEEEAFGTGTQVSYEISKESQTSYDQILPLSAIRQDQEGAYCLVAQEVETVLGTEYQAVRVNLTVKEKDSNNGAVSSSLGKEDLVITGSNKEISQGDKVRLKE